MYAIIAYMFIAEIFLGVNDHDKGERDEQYEVKLYVRLGALD